MPGAEATTSGVGAGRRDGLLYALLWLGGFDLRCTLLAVPPVIPLIHRDLGLDEKTVGMLTALPTLLMAAAAIPGALLIARLGARRALVVGLLAVAVASALRGVGGSLVVLFAMTVVMGAGVAVSQPAFPTLTRDWFPARVGFATAVYTNGLLSGETLPAALTGPLVAPALHGSWPLSLAFWSAPVALTVALVLLLSDHVAEAAETPPKRWWPDFGDRRMLQLGLVMGIASAAYFGTNAFIPDFVRATGRPEYKDAALAAINACQLPASFLVLAVSRHLVRRRWPFVASALAIAAATVTLVLAPGAAVIACAGVIGFAAALPLVLTLSLPPLLAAPADVPRFSAGVFVIMYGFSFAGPVVGGSAWDLTGRPAAAFWALAVGAALMTALALTLRLRPAISSAAGPARPGEGARPP